MLEQVFARARAAGRCTFIPYIVAGDPDIQTTELFLSALTQAGADIIELGIPYGDPVADGPTIAAAGHRALEAGVDLDGIFPVAERAASHGCAPILLFCYLNVILQYGLEDFARASARAQVRGVIVPDVTFEESGELRTALASANIAMPLLVAPSTPAQRAGLIAERSSGFVYVVSRLGVTGAGFAPDTSALASQLAQLRNMTDKPLAVGFGVSTPQHVSSVAPLADGVIVGSALIEAYDGKQGLEAVAAASSLSASLIEAMAPRLTREC